MLELKLLAAPVIGGLIGLITNGIAIKMLFRPFYPVKIGKYTLPFTPGLIPKEKSGIARAIGHTVGENLLDSETLKEALASENLHTALDRKVDVIIEQIGHEQRTVREFLAGKGYDHSADMAAEYIGQNLAGYVTDCLIQQKVADEILDYAIDEVMANLNSMIAMMAEPAIRKSQDAILEKMNEMIREQCPEILEGYIEKEYQDWMDKPMKELGLFLWKKKDVLKEKIWETYIILLEKKSGRFFERLDVSAIVEKKINEFDMQELEKLIMDISRKELHALVWIGGLLGAIIGFVNLLF